LAVVRYFMGTSMVIAVSVMVVMPHALAMP
jgi:hypothetical protein